MSNLKERLKKIQALAERGERGEKISAKRKLDELLAANGMTEADINEDQVQYYLFSYSGAPYRYKLLQQIIYKVKGRSNQYKIYRSKGTRNKIGLYCTPAEKLEIDLDFEFYSNLFDREVQILLDAFIQKQDLFPSDCPEQHINFDDLTPQERAEFLKMKSFEDSMTKQGRAAGMIEDNNLS